MKKRMLFTFTITSLGIILFFSCKKERSCEGCRENNKPPIAIAGPDQVITLPTDSVLLDGSSSSDPDGIISNWLWKKISGPAVFNTVKPNDSITIVKNLAKGAYQFELKVTDNNGLSAKDTIQIVVDNFFQSNRPPIAQAGVDQTITLPQNTITLHGGASTDPDNNIVSYQWAKISGPASFTIVHTNSIQTEITGLVQGIYHFDLKVTDAGALYSKDTVTITVNNTLSNQCSNARPVVNAQLIPVGSLSLPREHTVVAAAGNKILFAGGLLNGNQVSRVDIYSISNNTWVTAELCAPRHLMPAVANGNKIFFAGGETSDGTWPVDSVDIYDVFANTWSVAHLSTAGHSIAAAAVGDKVLFAGGDGGFTGTGRQLRVDIYDLPTNTWTTSTLSEAKRGGHIAISQGNKVYISGGETWPNIGQWTISSKIDIYDENTNTWSSSFLNEEKFFHVGIAVSGKLYWAGGATGSPPNTLASCAVEIKDISTGQSSIQHLFAPATWFTAMGQNAVVKDNKIIFYRPESINDTDKFDIYDIATSSWSIGLLPFTIRHSSIISYNNTIYIAGGFINNVLSNQVWKLEF